MGFKTKSARFSQLFRVARKILGVSLTTYVVLIALSFDVSAQQVFTVNTNLDVEFDGCAVNNCTLREAVSAANSSSSNDVIRFDPAFFSAPQTITLVNGELGILAAGGLSINNTTLYPVTISGNNASRVFTINPDANATLNRLIITNGYSDGINQQNDGGGIYIYGTLTLNNCVVKSSYADLNGGGIAITSRGILNLVNSTVTDNRARRYGGGIVSYRVSGVGRISIIGSTIFNNRTTTAVPDGAGGGIDHSGPLTLINSTVSGNMAIVAPIIGGGIWSGSTAEIINSTIANNSAEGSGSGSGICRCGSNNSTMTLRNTIVAGNLNNATTPDTAAPASDRVVSAGNNLIGNPGSITSFNQPGDQTGTSSAPLDPRVAPLGLYGGATMTHALLANSTATNAASNLPGTPITDQRSAARQGNVDIGSYELNNSYLAVLGQLAVVNQAYNLMLVPNSGNFAFNLTGGNLPPGMSLSGSSVLNSAVALTGTPTAAGTYNFTVTGTESMTGATVTTNYSLTVINPFVVANVEIGGRIVTLAGSRSAARAIVTLTNAAGEVRYAVTNAFGYYRFANVSTGEYYVLSVNQKGYSLTPQSIFVNEASSDFNFTLQPIS